MGQRGQSKRRELKFFFMEKEMRIINWEQDSCTPQKSISS